MAALQINASATRFYISTVPAMPEITLTAVLTGAPPLPPSAFTWHFALAYTGFTPASGSFSRNARPRTHPAIPAVTGNPAQVPFTVITGGRLTVRVEATVNGQRLVATRNDITIGGTNPSAAQLLAAVPTKLIRQMIQQESGGAQFCDGRGGLPATAINPNWSQDNNYGVGLGQLTDPAPSPDECWNWRTNAASLQRRFRGKRQIGANLHNLMMASAQFQAEVQALNAWRAVEGQPPLRVTLPALTEEQQDLAGLRAYNGMGPKLKTEYLPHINEYEPATTRLTSATRKGRDGRPLQSPRVPAVDAQGVGSWTQITGAERLRRCGGTAPGDADYVAHVLAQPG